MNISILFEQSGTFKNVLQIIGHIAKDYDICNMFQQTDVQCDIFDVLDTCNYKAEMFNADLILAFFPCTYFSSYNDMIIKGTWYNYKYMNEEQKHNYMLDRKAKQEKYFTRLQTLIAICRAKKLPLIIENPVSTNMTRFIKENNINHVKHIRNLHGDVMRKPTYYLLFNGVEITQLDTIKKGIERTIEKSNHDDIDLKRSLIHPDYVDNLIKHTYVNGINLFYGNNA